MKRYRFSNKEREVVTHLIRHQAPPRDAGNSDEATRRYAHRVGPELAPTVHGARGDPQSRLHG